MEMIVEEKPLSLVEQTRLQILEAVIQENFMAYVAVGNALLEIRESRLYRTTEGRTWEGYCREIWDMAARRADQLIAAKNVIENLRTIVLKNDGTIDQDLLPANEAQARELARLGEDEQRQVWQQLIDGKMGEETEETPVKITAKAVKNAVKALKGDLFIRAARAAKDEVQPRHKASPDRESDNFKQAWADLMDQIEDEQRSGWQHTARETVFNALVRLASVVGDCGEQGMRDKKIVFRSHNLDKLLAAGWTVLRKGGNKRCIEQLSVDGTWLLYGEYTTEEQCEEAYRDALLESTSIQA